MRHLCSVLAISAGVLAAAAADAYEFPLRPLTANTLTKNSLTMSGSVAGWISCVPDPIDEFDPLTCEVWVYDANAGGAAHAITDNAVEDECVDIHQRDVVFRRGVGAGQVVLRDLDAGETVLSSAGVDTAFYACPQISSTRVVWERGGQVVVYDRALATERVVGANASYLDLAGDYVAWQEGTDTAAEIWFLDARSAANVPIRLTDNAIPDERPAVDAIGNLLGFPPDYITTSPNVVWNRIVDGRYEVSSWNGSATTLVTDASSVSQYFPDVTGYVPSSFFFEQPAIAWASDAELHYCTICDGNPTNVLGLPAADPFLAGSPLTRLEAIDGGWIVFWRIYPAPASQFDLGFYEIGGGVVTPITDDAELDDAATLGFRSVTPVGPVVVWRRVVGSDSQIFYAPEPATAGIAALVAIGALARRRGRRAERSPAA